MACNPGLMTYASREIMSKRLADLVEPRLAGGGVLAVSGGSTPELFYKELSGRKIAWPKVKAILVDERWVPLGHPRSNEAFVKQAFSGATGIEIVGLYNGATGPADAVEEIKDRLECANRPFDVVVLGMGPDGHTASWFPHAEGLDDALFSKERVSAVRAKQSDVTGEEVDRMTLTLRALEDARLVLLLLTGDEKRAVFERACEDGAAEDMPVRAILRARPDMLACWAP